MDAGPQVLGKTVGDECMWGLHKTKQNSKLTDKQARLKMSWNHTHPYHLMPYYRPVKISNRLCFLMSHIYVNTLILTCSEVNNRRPKLSNLYQNQRKKIYPISWNHNHESEQWTLPTKMAIWHSVVDR